MTDIPDDPNPEVDLERRSSDVWFREYLETISEGVKRVDSRCENLEASTLRVNRIVGDMRVEIAQLQVKSSIWGAISGILGAIGTTLIFLSMKN